MMLNSNVTRAEVYAVIVSCLESNQARKNPKLLLLLNRLRVAFHPNSLPLLPSAHSILFYYPPNPVIFRGWETLGEDERSAEEDQVSRVTADNRAQIDYLRQTFWEMTKQIMEEQDWTRQVAIVSHMEKLGVEWGTFEANIETVKLWFQRRWGVYGACP
ncbi:hypothetical protein HOY82DRAFT_611528 [Tuber indicum]|nr:hypothetical protein HOY82DRAFT_611528 [Tuber indicum]